MYLNYFKLEQQPFTISPDPALYCQLPSHDESIRTVLWSIEQGELIIKITGDVGVGKTLIARKVIEELDQRKIAYVSIANPNLSAEGIYRSILSDLKVVCNQDTCRFDLLKKVHETIKKHAKRKKRIVMIIDEAQVMSCDVLESIRLLTNLDSNNNAVLQIILFGQLELDETLKKPEMRQLAQRITFSYHLRSMSEKEVGIYLRHRLISSGHTDGNLFSKKAIKLIYNASKGVPRVINIVAHKSLLLTRVNNQFYVDKKQVRLAVKDSQNIMISNMTASLTGKQKKTLTTMIIFTFSILVFTVYLFIRSRI